MNDHLELKLKYGDLYLIELADQIFIWRPMKWKDYRRYRDFISVNPFLAPDIEDHIYENYVIDSTDEISSIDELPAGIVSTVVKAILSIAGAANGQAFENLLEIQRGTILSFEEQIVTLICKAFPYKPEDLEELDWLTILKRLAQAEKILSNQLPEIPVRVTQNIDSSNKLDLAADQKAINQGMVDPDLRNMPPPGRPTRARKR